MATTKLFKKNSLKQRRRIGGLAGLANYKKMLTTERKRAEERMRYGSLGPASPVRKIDPATGEVIAIIPAK